MAERKMTPKFFLAKTKTKAAASAAGFLAAHREFLSSGALAEKTVLVLNKLDSKEIMPTPALAEITDIVFRHLLSCETKKAKEDLENAKISAPKRDGWTATILDSRGNVCTRINEEGEEVDLEKGFAMSSDADGWVDRRLTEGNAASDWYGVIRHNTLRTKEGKPFESIILRADALARILKKGKTPICKVKPQTTNRLSFGVKAQQDHCSFSKG
jgi:hypothetical protein